MTYQSPGLARSSAFSAVAGSTSSSTSGDSATSAASTSASAAPSVSTASAVSSITSTDSPAGVSPWKVVTVVSPLSDKTSLAEPQQHEPGQAEVDPTDQRHHE